MKPLSFNMSKFHKIAGDKHSSTMRHEDGHEIKIAHAALPTLQRKQLERMPINAYDGTCAGAPQQCSSPPSPTPNPTPVTNDETSSMFKGAFKADGGEIHRANNPKLQQSLVRNPPPANQQVLKENYRHDPLPRFAQGGEADSEQDPVAVDSFLKGFHGVKNYKDGTDDASNDDSSSQVPDQSSKHTININVNPQPGQTQLANVQPPSGLDVPADLDPNKINVPKVASAAGIPMNANQTPNFAAGLQQEGQGNKDVAAVQAAQAQANIPQEQEAAKVQQNYANQIQELTKQHYNEFDQFGKELAANNIKPNQYLNNMSDVGKISTALGVFLGSAPTGHGGSNAALDFVNKQIDRDIGAQKENRDNVKTIYGAYEKLYGDTQAAYDMTRGAMLSIIGHHANIIANKLGTPMSAAKLNVLNGALTQEKAKSAADAAYNALAPTPGGPGTAISNKPQVGAGPAPQGGNAPQPNSPDTGLPQRTPKQQSMYDSMSPQEKQAYDTTSSSAFVPDKILAPGALYAASSMKKEDPEMYNDAVQANQAERFLNGVKGDGAGGIHDIYQKMWNNSKSNLLAAYQRHSGGINGALAAGAGEYIGGPKGALMGGILGSKANIPAFTDAQKDYERQREKIKQEVAASLHGLISVNDLDKWIDPFLPGFNDDAAQAAKKEADLRDAIKKSLTSGRLESRGLWIK